MHSKSFPQPIEYRSMFGKPSYLDLRESEGVQHFPIGDKVLTGISSSTWGDFISQLEGLESPGDYIVSPELITVSGVSWDSERQLATLAKERIAQAMEASRRFPPQTLLLGTPLVLPHTKSLTNSVIAIRNGVIVGRTDKRTMADPDERIFFKPNAEVSPFTLSGTDIGVLICSDFVYARLFGEGSFQTPNKWMAGQIRAYGQVHLLGKDVQMISPDMRRLIVISCWGVGSNNFSDKRTQDSINEDYLLALRNSAAYVMRIYPQIEEIVMIDRTATGAQGDVSTVPFNVRFVRSLETPQ